MAAIKQITSETICKILDWKSVISAVEEAMVNVSEKRAVQNVRSVTQIPKTDNILFAMPGYVNTDKSTALGCKLVTLFPSNAQKNLPSILANILLFNENTGALEVIMDGTEITAWRTAAASVVATKYIRDVNSQNKTLAIIGAGTQAKIHAIAFQQQFKFVKVHVWNRTHEKAEMLCKELQCQSTLHGTIEEYIPFQNVEECVKEADVIVTTTSATTPLIHHKWVKPGVHINAVGVGNSVIELDEDIYKSAVVFVDHVAGIEHELQHLVTRGVVFQGEIGSIINGTLPKPISSRTTIFQSLGMAAEDCAVAKMVYEKYLQGFS